MVVISLTVRTDETGAEMMLEQDTNNHQTEAH